jgi:hypothetical protein
LQLHTRHALARRRDPLDQQINARQPLALHACPRERL